MLLTLLSNQGNEPAVNSKFWVNISGVWKQAVAYINISGVWKQATVSLNVADTWK